MKKYRPNAFAYHFPETFLLTILTWRISSWTSFTIGLKRQTVTSSYSSTHVPYGMTYGRSYASCLKSQNFPSMRHLWERRQSLKTTNVMEGFVLVHTYLRG